LPGRFEEIAARWVAAGLTVGFLAQWAWADELEGIPSPAGAVFGPSGDGGMTVSYSLGF